MIPVKIFSYNITLSHIKKKYKKLFSGKNFNVLSLKSGF
jgi:hypothetical protein